MLDVGSRVPELSMQTSEGRPVRLSDYRGRPALVYFMRAASCMMCYAHVRDLVGRQGDFAAKGVQVLIAVPEAPAKAAKWKARREVPYEVLSGREGSAYEAVGLHAKMFGAMQQSGDVLVDAEGRILHIHAATVPNYDKQGILEAVGRLPRPSGAA